MIIIAGTITINPDRRQEAIQAALQMAEATQAERGCLAYQFYADLQEPNTFFIFEEWETEEALAAHFQSEHMKAFQAQLPQFVAGQPQIKQYQVSSAEVMG